MIPKCTRSFPPRTAFLPRPPSLAQREQEGASGQLCPPGGLQPGPLRGPEECGFFVSRASPLES